MAPTKDSWVGFYSTTNPAYAKLYLEALKIGFGEFVPFRLVDDAPWYRLEFNSAEVTYLFYAEFNRLNKTKRLQVLFTVFVNGYLQALRDGE